MKYHVFDLFDIATNYKTIEGVVVMKLSMSQMDLSF